MTIDLVLTSSLQSLPGKVFWKPMLLHCLQYCYDPRLWYIALPMCLNENSLWPHHSARGGACHVVTNPQHNVVRWWKPSFVYTSNIVCLVALNSHHAHEGDKTKSSCKQDWCHIYKTIAHVAVYAYIHIYISSKPMVRRWHLKWFGHALFDAEMDLKSWDWKFIVQEVKSDVRMFESVVSETIICINIFTQLQRKPRSHISVKILQVFSWIIVIQQTWKSRWNKKPAGTHTSDRSSGLFCRSHWPQSRIECFSRFRLQVQGADKFSH